MTKNYLNECAYDAQTCLHAPVMAKNVQIRCSYMPIMAKNDQTEHLNVPAMVQKHFNACMMAKNVQMCI